MTEEPDVVIRAALLIDARRPQEALALLGPALAADPSADLYSLAAAAHNQLGRHREALDNVGSALALDPTHLLAMVRGAAGARALGDSEEALRLAGLAVEHHPSSVDAHIAMAYGLVAARRSTALAAAREAVRLAPDAWQAHFVLGWAGLAFYDFALAERAFKEVLHLRPDHPAAMNNLALARLERGELRGVAAGFADALAADAQLEKPIGNLMGLGRTALRPAHIGLTITWAVQWVLLDLAHRPGQPIPAGVAASVTWWLLGASAVALLAGIGALAAAWPRRLWSVLASLPVRDPVLSVCVLGQGAVSAAIATAALTAIVQWNWVAGVLLWALIFPLWHRTFLRRRDRPPRGRSAH